MVRYGLGMCIILLLFMGCSNKAVAPVPDPQPLPAHGFQLHAGDKIHELNGIPLRLDDKTSVKIFVPEAFYVYVFSRKEGEVRALPFYDQTPGKGIGTKAIELKSLETEEVRNTEWFLVRSEQNLAQDQKESVRRFIAESKPPAVSDTIVYPKTAQWYIVSLDWNEGINSRQFRVLGNIEITSAPFSIQIFVQKKGTKEFRLFDASKESLEIGDRCKFRIDTYRDIKNMAFFLRENKEVSQLFPGKGDTTVSVNSNTTLHFPLEKELTILSDSLPKHLCCFCPDKPLGCESLKNWLTDMDSSKVEIVLTKGHKGVVHFDAPAPLYTVILADK